MATLWITRRKFVNIETGELVEEKNIGDYYTVRVTKKTTHNATTQRGVKELTIEVRPTGQGKLWK